MGTFSELFKRYRLKAAFNTLAEFGDALSEKGYAYEVSVFSHWQKGTRLPSNRQLTIEIIRIFAERGAIKTIDEANEFLSSVGFGYLTDEESHRVFASSRVGVWYYSPKKVIEFLKSTGESKKLKRTGWKEKKIKNPESVAEHSYRVSVLAMILADHLGVNTEKLVQMAIIHDLGEIITGDIVWSRGAMIDMKIRAEKEEQEKKGVAKVFKLLGKANFYLELFEEMIERKTPEAKIFWQLDKLEMAMQALEYEVSEKKQLDEFFINADLQIFTPYLKKLMKEIMRQRENKI